MEPTSITTATPDEEEELGHVRHPPQHEHRLDEAKRLLLRVEPDRQEDREGHERRAMDRLEERRRTWRRERLSLS